MVKKCVKSIVLFLLLFGISGTLLQSCSTSEDAFNGRWIQKRKYNKGFFVNLGGKKKVKVNESHQTKDKSEPLSTFHSSSTTVSLGSSELGWKHIAEETLPESTPLRSTEYNSSATENRIRPKQIRKFFRAIKKDSSEDEEDLGDNKPAKHAVTGFVMSLASFVSIITPASILGLLVFGILGIVFSIKGLRSTKHGFAVAGLVISTIMLFLLIVAIALLIIVISNGALF